MGYIISKKYMVKINDFAKVQKYILEIPNYFLLFFGDKIKLCKHVRIARPSRTVFELFWNIFQFNLILYIKFKMKS